MTPPKPPPTQASEPTYLARIGPGQGSFSGLYALSSPGPPLLERSKNGSFIWNYANMAIAANVYHRAFKGLRLHPGEGPRLIEISVKRHPGRIWLARAYIPRPRQSSHYVLTLGARPTATILKNAEQVWTPHHLWISPTDYLAKFSGVRLAPAAAPVPVKITVTAIDDKAKFDAKRK